MAANERVATPTCVTASSRGWALGSSLNIDERGLGSHPPDRQRATRGWNRADVTPGLWTHRSQQVIARALLTDTTLPEQTCSRPGEERPKLRPSRRK